MKFITAMLCSALALFAGEYYYMNQGKRVYLQKIDSEINSRDMHKNTIFFEESGGKRVGVTNRILVKFKSKDSLQSCLDRYGLKVLRHYDAGDIYLLEAGSPIDALNIANTLYESADVEFAHPDMKREWRLR